MSLLFLNNAPVKVSFNGGAPEAVSIQNDVLKHVLQGEHGTNTVKGGHSTNNENVEITDIRADDNGVREAHVSVDGKPKTNGYGPNRDIGTLFPEEWSDQRIVDEFSEGLRSGAFPHPAGGDFVTSPSGVKIKFYKTGMGVITTFFPLID